MELLHQGVVIFPIRHLGMMNQGVDQGGNNLVSVRTLVHLCVDVLVVLKCGEELIP